MRRVYQRLRTKENGDCFSACLASLLELPLAVVPNFNAEAGETGGLAQMLNPANKWLLKNFQLKLVVIRGNEVSYKGILMRRFFRFVPGNTLMIGQYPSPNVKGVNHAVLIRNQSQQGNFILVHDPNRKGRPIGNLQSPHFVFMVVPSDKGLKNIVRMKMGKGLIKR